MRSGKFKYKLDPSDGLFSAGRWSDTANGATWRAIAIHEKSVRGTISNRLKTKDQDPAKLAASIQSPNLQTVDVATLPNNTDTLRLRFTLRVLGGAGTPAACNNADYQAKLLRTVKAHKDEHGFGELTHRYAINLANGRFLWRNRVGAEQISVEVRHLENGEPRQSWSFDALRFSLPRQGVVEGVELVQHEVDAAAHVLDAETDHDARERGHVGILAHIVRDAVVLAQDPGVRRPRLDHLLQPARARRFACAAAQAAEQAGEEIERFQHQRTPPRVVHQRHRPTACWSRSTASGATRRP